MSRSFPSWMLPKATPCLSSPSFDRNEKSKRNPGSLPKSAAILDVNASCVYATCSYAGRLHHALCESTEIYTSADYFKLATKNQPPRSASCGLGTWVNWRPYRWMERGCPHRSTSRIREPPEEGRQWSAPAFPLVRLTPCDIAFHEIKTAHGSSSAGTAVSACNRR